VATVLLLRADALHQTGRVREARELYHQLARQQGFIDLDAETRALIANIATHQLTGLAAR
jgi:hypothetical protein